MNGAATGLVAFDVSPPVRGRCIGVPVTARRLGLSLVEPDAFLQAARSGSGQLEP